MTAFSMLWENGPLENRAKLEETLGKILKKPTNWLDGKEYEANIWFDEFGKAELLVVLNFSLFIFLPILRLIFCAHDLSLMIAKVLIFWSNYPPAFISMGRGFFFASRIVRYMKCCDRIISLRTSEKWQKKTFLPALFSTDYFGFVGLIRSWSNLGREEGEKVEKKRPRRDRFLRWMIHSASVEVIFEKKMS